MALLRSTFWLGVAFLAIGPQIDYSGAVGSLSKQTVQSGQNLLIEHTDVRECGTLECVGTKMAVSAGVQSINSLLLTEILPLNVSETNGQSSPVIPSPRNRLDRS